MLTSPNYSLDILSIPTVLDRVMQAIVKNALEPYWEAHFEPASYGFRPGRSCHDAIAKVYLTATPNKRKKWVLDADIEGAFDNINHQKLLEVIGPFPARELVRQWLKAGYMQEGTLHRADTGTPQGALISPLLANIALHGLETALGVKYDKQGTIRGPRALVRYADDFVVFCESKEDTEAACQDLQDWLAKRGLKLSEDKTQVVHLRDGFDFLGFNIRHYRAAKTSKSGYKLLIKPSKESVGKLKSRLRKEWMKLKGCNIVAVLKRLNPILRGWANYFRIGVSKKTFTEIDSWILNRCVRYVKSSHPRKSWKWCCSKYWGKLNLNRQDQWVFGNKATGEYLLKTAWTPIKRHVLVKGATSPDDPTLKQYWLEHQKRKIDDLPTKLKSLAKAQEGLCAQCKTTLFNGEELHKHHHRPKSEGGTDEQRNLKLVYLFCHQQLHKNKRVVSKDAK